MKICFQLAIILLLTICSFPVAAEDRTVTGNLAEGIFDTYGNVQTSGVTTVPANTQVIYQTLGNTILSGGFKVAADGELRIRPIEGPDAQAWKDQYFPGQTGVDMSADPDGDGMTNLTELLLGTDPNSYDADPFGVDADNDGLADSWEEQTYGDISNSGSDDPNSDGISVATDYQEFLDFYHSNAFLYLEGDLYTKNYKAIEIHTSGSIATTVLGTSDVHLIKSQKVKLNPGFSVNRGGQLSISNSELSALAMTPPEAPSNLQVISPGNTGTLQLTWKESPDYDVAGYWIYRNNTHATTEYVESTSHEEAGLAHNTEYSYHVTAVDKVGKESTPSNSATITTDFVPPNLQNIYPTDGAIESSAGKPFFVRATYGDSGSGIASIKVFDGSGNNITNSALLNGNSLELLILKPEIGQHSHSYSFEVTDHGNNVFPHTLSFTLNNTPLITRAEPPGGQYTGVQDVTLTCGNPNATIYYTDTGYPPIIGTSPSGQGEIANISVNTNTSLQFLAVDQSGNEEEIKSEVYIFNNDLLETTNLTATYQDETDTEPRKVVLTWDTVTAPDPIQGYRLYRCDNGVECQILLNSSIGRYPPAIDFKIAESPTGITSFTDTALQVGSTYEYGVLAVDNAGLPGLLSPLVAVDITTTDEVADLADSIARASAWLKSRQDRQGYWGTNEDTRILATSQALSAFSDEAMDARLARGIFFLRGQYADNNDYLSRKIITLAAFDQNIDQPVSRLIAEANSGSENVNGWGTHKNYVHDALDTSLGLIAFLTPEVPGITDSGTLLATGTDMFSSDGAGHYGWVPGIDKDTSVYVSALAHHAMEKAGVTPLPDRSWIFTGQQSNGSFNDSIVDTAAVLLWLAPGETVKNSGVTYLIAQQETNGSWDNDEYLTGLCLEALLEGFSQ